MFYAKLEMRSVERGICHIVTSTVNELFLQNYGQMHCACTKRLYFHFRSKIWRHYRLPRPRFPKKRKFRRFACI